MRLKKNDQIKKKILEVVIKENTKVPLLKTIMRIEWNGLATYTFQ